MCEHSHTRESSRMSASARGRPNWAQQASRLPLVQTNITGSPVLIPPGGLPSAATSTFRKAAGSTSAHSMSPPARASQARRPGARSRRASSTVTPESLQARRSGSARSPSASVALRAYGPGCSRTSQPRVCGAVPARGSAAAVTEQGSLIGRARRPTRRGRPAPCPRRRACRGPRAGPRAAPTGLRRARARPRPRPRRWRPRP